MVDEPVVHFESIPAKSSMPGWYPELLESVVQRISVGSRRAHAAVNQELVTTQLKTAGSLQTYDLDNYVSSRVLFPSMGNTVLKETISGSAVAARVLARLGAVIVAPWKYGWGDLLDGRATEGILNVTAPTSEIARFYVSMVSTRRGAVREVILAARNAAVRVELPAVVFTEFANPALRQACDELGVGFVDETGWVCLRNDTTPALLVAAQGAARSSAPAREATMSNLGGSGAGKVIRALWRINVWPIGVRPLADQAKVSPGTVSKVLPTLALHGAVEREEGGRVTGISRRLLLDRWTQDYRFTTSNRSVTWCLAPRGLLAAERSIASLPAGTFIRSTGPLAARNSLSGDLLAVTPLILLAYYTDDPASVAERCGFVEVDNPSAANVVLAQPWDVNDGELTSPFGGARAQVMPVLPAQILADLMTMGGRYPEQAEQLFGYLYPDEGPVG